MNVMEHRETVLLQNGKSNTETKYYYNIIPLSTNTYHWQYEMSKTLENVHIFTWNHHQENQIS